jgi:hypothetical protein
VSFSVDRVDDALAEGWSVLASGEVAVITDPAGLAGASRLGIEPWAGGQRDVFVRRSCRSCPCCRPRSC